MKKSSRRSEKFTVMYITTQWYTVEISRTEQILRRDCFVNCCFLKSRVNFKSQLTEQFFYLMFFLKILFVCGWCKTSSFFLINGRRVRQVGASWAFLCCTGPHWIIIQHYITDVLTGNRVLLWIVAEVIHQAVNFKEIHFLFDTYIRVLLPDPTPTSLDKVGFWPFCCIFLDCLPTLHSGGGPWLSGVRI